MIIYLFQMKSVEVEKKPVEVEEKPAAEQAAENPSSVSSGTGTDPPAPNKQALSAEASELKPTSIRSSPNDDEPVVSIVDAASAATKSTLDAKSTSSSSAQVTPQVSSANSFV
jgi:hypothetical protein